MYQIGSTDKRWIMSLYSFTECNCNNTYLDLSPWRIFEQVSSPYSFLPAFPSNSHGNYYCTSEYWHRTPDIPQLNPNINDTIDFLTNIIPALAPLSPLSCYPPDSPKGKREWGNGGKGERGEMSIMPIDSTNTQILSEHVNRKNNETRQAAGGR